MLASQLASVLHLCSVASLKAGPKVIGGLLPSRADAGRLSSVGRFCVRQSAGALSRAVTWQRKTDYLLYSEDITRLISDLLDATTDADPFLVPPCTALGCGQAARAGVGCGLGSGSGTDGIGVGAPGRLAGGWVWWPGWLVGPLSQ